MSKATKKKYVTQEVLEDYVLPSEGEYIVKVLASRGNNLHEAEDEHGSRFLISMPTKFRRNVWIKKGDYVIASPISEGDKVKAEIAHILYRDQIKYIRQEGQWPKGFTDAKQEKPVDGIPDDMMPPDSDSEDSDSDIPVGFNPNRRPLQQQCDVSSSSSSEEET